MSEDLEFKKSDFDYAGQEKRRESRESEKMLTKELDEIEKQISEAAEFLQDEIGPHLKLTDATLSVVRLACACDRLLQVIRYQQTQIEELIQARRADCGHPAVINGRCVGCGAPWEEVKN